MIYYLIGGLGLLALCIWFYCIGKRIQRLEESDREIGILQAEKKDLRRWVKDVDELVKKSQKLKDEIPDKPDSIADVVRVLHEAREDTPPDPTGPST